MKSSVALLVTVVLWAAAFPAIRAGLQEYSVGHLVLLRFAIASLALLAIAFVRRAPLPRRQDLLRIAILGIIGMTIYPFACSYGELTVPAGTASILINLSPIFTAMLSALLLREGLPPHAWLGVAVAFSGAALIALGRGSHVAFTAGVVVLVFAAFTQATQFVLMKSLLARYDAITLTLYTVWAGTLVDVVFVRGWWSAVTHASLRATAAVAFLGLFATVFATVTWSYALKRIPAPTAAAFLYLIPPFSILIAWLWLREPATPVMIAGGVLAICGVAIVKSQGPQSPRASAWPSARIRTSSS